MRSDVILTNQLFIFLLARPLLAFKRDLSRPTSETRVPTDHESMVPHSIRQVSTSSSTPLEVIDIDTSGSFKTIFDKVKNTLSPSIKRRTSENPANDETNSSSKDNRNSSISSISTNKSRKDRLHNQKSVSFAENIDNDNDSDVNNQYTINDRNEIVRNAHTLADQILLSSIDEATIKTTSTNGLSKTNDDDFEKDFHRTIKPRHISTDNMEDLVYQDLSAEIVAYVLKHALRTLRKEQNESELLTENEKISNQNEQDDDFIDLK
jgi:hypothetical protein